MGREKNVCVTGWTCSKSLPVISYSLRIVTQIKKYKEREKILNI